MWLHHDVPLAPSEHYSISKAAKVDGLVSSLRVRRVGLPDLGEYSCSIANGHGEDRRTVKLNRVGQWLVDDAMKSTNANPGCCQTSLTSC